MLILCTYHDIDSINLMHLEISLDFSCKSKAKGRKFSEVCADPYFEAHQISLEEFAKLLCSHFFQKKTNENNKYSILEPMAGLGKYFRFVFEGNENKGIRF